MLTEMEQLLIIAYRGFSPEKKDWFMQAIDLGVSSKETEKVFEKIKTIDNLESELDRSKIIQEIMTDIEEIRRMMVVKNSTEM